MGRGIVIKAENVGVASAEDHAHVLGMISRGLPRSI
jgi:hypothetical protein